MQATFAEVIIPVPLRQTFTYAIPSSLSADCEPGRRVMVPFGKTKLQTGLLYRLHAESPSHPVKEIIAVYDDRPIITKEQLSFWEWMAEYYMCALGEIFKAALPAGLKLESETFLYLNPDAETSDVEGRELQILSLISAENSCSLKKLCRVSDFNPLPVVKRLIDRKIVLAEQSVQKKYSPKYAEYVSLSPDLKNKDAFEKASGQLPSRAFKQQELLLFLRNNVSGSALTKKQLLEQSKTSLPVLKSLAEKGLVCIEKKEVSRLQTEDFPLEEEKNLTISQQQAQNEIVRSFEKKDVVLLHGVTASGKTEIYISLIKREIEKGNQVLYLLPEIALTTQITLRLRKIFGSRMGVYHSKFSDSERIETWRQLQAGKFSVILGVRSSIFLPFSKLSLVIVDEEHESSYKQYHPAPRYHARDAAIVLAHIFKAKVLLGTATPSFETYFNAKTGKYALVELLQRYKNVQLPKILVADTREARRKKQMKSFFSPQMLAAVGKAKENGEQIILFRNRRGFSPFAECVRCGYIPRCENCDVSLTYHKKSMRLKCHYCGYEEPARRQCKMCQTPEGIRAKGFGTQKIEDKIKEYFPSLRTGRMDRDTTSGKDAHARIIHDFRNQNIDILIGTQMLTKGLDFDHVSLVGIPDADSLLNFPDFRAFERAFQLMIQVSGRAGRRNKQGTVIIQTGDPSHPIIQYVIKHDYKGMFESRLLVRKQFDYPPFYRLIRLEIKHRQKNISRQAALFLTEELRKISPSGRILGPEAPPVARIKLMYIHSILIKLPRQESAAQFKERVMNRIDCLQAMEEYRYVQVTADVDPM